MPNRQFSIALCQYVRDRYTTAEVDHEMSITSSKVGFSIVEPSDGQHMTTGLFAVFLGFGCAGVGVFAAVGKVGAFVAAQDIVVDPPE